MSILPQRLTAHLALGVCLGSGACAAPAIPGGEPSGQSSQTEISAQKEQTEHTPAHDPSEITLKRIMADPDWIGNPPRSPYWADDGGSVYYERKRVGSEERDLIQVDLDGRRLRVVSDEERGTIDVAAGDFSADRRHKLYSRAGDLYLKDVISGEIRQLTRTVAVESSPFFLRGDESVQFRRGKTILVRELATGLEYQPAELRLEDDPEEEEEPSEFLHGQQKRLFDSVREAQERKQSSRQARARERAADKSRVPLPWYLGQGSVIHGSSLSPDAGWLVLRLSDAEDSAGRSDSMPNYVSEDGYVEVRDVRSKVGSGKVRSERVVLLDISRHQLHELELAALPGLNEDPLAELAAAQKKENETDEAESSTPSETGQPERDDSPKQRPLTVRKMLWNESGDRVALQLYSQDRKDRWIATVDLANGKLIPVHRLQDPGWVNWTFNEMGWLADDETLFFLSEESGYSHLYSYSTVAGRLQALTSGEWEVSSPRLAADGEHIYLRANPEHPGVHECYRLELESGDLERVTQMGGRLRFTLAPDESRILISHSTLSRPNELFVQSTGSGAQSHRITQTVSPAFSSLPWIEPEIVPIPSRHGRPIYSRVYTPPLEAPAKRPGVVFIHGSGYLQNAHLGWSGYFREFMFHCMLAHRGYVVLDMDYRASAGYGRDWRTAIYRRMGNPELEDLEDGVAWLVEERGVDPARVGVYGGSYGGFLTLMALFKKPDLFACGAALRPVTDWAHYNHPYTANILNTPELDPEAYLESSPIEFAEGLSKPLLICHGMLDDNVFFQDSVRLAQRLIELEKEGWELAPFPVEAHGFRNPSSWLDEYRRIYKLFETHLR